MKRQKSANKFLKLNAKQMLAIKRNNRNFYGSENLCNRKGNL